MQAALPFLKRMPIRGLSTLDVRARCPIASLVYIPKRALNRSSARFSSVGMLKMVELVIDPVSREHRAHPQWPARASLVMLQHLRQPFSRVRVQVGGNLFGCAFGNDFAAAFAAFRSQIDHPIGALDHVQIVLDHDQATRRRRSACGRPSAASIHRQSAGRWSARPECKARGWPAKAWHWRWPSAPAPR